MQVKVGSCAGKGEVMCSESASLVKTTGSLLQLDIFSQKYVILLY